MQNHLLRCLLVFVAFSSCVSTANKKSSEPARAIRKTMPAVTSSFRDVDTTFIMQPALPANQSPVSLMDQPRTEEGGFVLAPGLYEADFKTYCLQPGTPGPSSKDVYFQTSLEGGEKDIIQTILTNSRKEDQLNQKDIQLLLWSVVSHSDFQKLSPDVKLTAMQLLSPKQLFHVQGGVMGVVKTVAKAMPSSGGGDLKKLFDLSVRSYEAYEQLAVLNTPSQLIRTDMTQDQWYLQEDGYYVRYLPKDYKQSRIQVYVPGTMNDPAAIESGNYILFDPTSWAVVPANSNAQRLGIGGPVINIVKTVIKNIKLPKRNPRPKETKQTNPKIES